MSADRALWTGLTDAQLLAQCEVDTYRASGPGGQKRNKTSSAVRLRHTPSGLIVIAEESRSQHENKAKALQRLRRELYLKLRRDLPPEQLTEKGLVEHIELTPARSPDGRVHLASAKDPRFWPLAGLVLDVLVGCQARVAEAAAALGLSTGNLIDFLQLDDKLWQQANVLRVQFGHSLLR
jgi:hypothetical protein